MQAEGSFFFQKNIKILLFLVKQQSKKRWKISNKHI